MPTSNEQFIQKLTEIIEANLNDEQFGVSELASEVGMNRSSLHRKLKTITEQSVSQFIRETRLKRAYELLQQNTDTATEIAYMVGFGSVSYFSKCFHDFYGFPPGKVNEKDNDNPEYADSEISYFIKSKKYGYYPLALITLAAVTIFGILFFNQLKSKNNEAEKSIAVPVFITNNLVAEESIFTEVLREELIVKLSLIEHFKVPLKSTTDKNTSLEMSLKETAKKLNVNYILQGNSRKINSKVWIHLELIEAASEKILWTKNYELEITNENIFTLQEDVAFSVANELNTIVSTPEKESIKFQYTNNITAYNYYLRAEKYMDFFDLNNNVQDRELAKEYYQKSIQFDSKYSLPYVGLGWYYFRLSNAAFEIKLRSFSNSALKMPKNFNINKSQLYLDSALAMSEKAIELNNNNYDAYILQGQVYTEKGIFEKANEVLRKAIEINPNNYQGYEYMAYNFSRYHNFSKAVKYLLISRKFNKEPLENVCILRSLARNLRLAGFPDEAKMYLDVLLKQENDSIEYFTELCYNEIGMGNSEQALINLTKAYMQDTTNLTSVSLMAWNNMYLRNRKEMYKYYIKFDSALTKYSIKPEPNLYYGYFYSLFGNKEKSDYYFNSAIQFSVKKIEFGHPQSRNFETSYFLACIYSARGDKEKALENLYMLKNKERCPVWMVSYFDMDPMLDNLREEPEFMEIYKHIKVVYMKEHEKVKNVLITEGIINP